MSIARHLGLKSRLLDWTAGFWIALSFFMELKAIVLLNINLNPFLNPFYVCIDDSLLAGLVLQIFKVRFVVHEIVFTEHCHAWSFSLEFQFVHVKVCDLTLNNK